MRDAFRSLDQGLDSVRIETVKKAISAEERVQRNCGLTGRSDCAGYWEGQISGLLAKLRIAHRYYYRIDLGNLFDAARRFYKVPSLGSYRARN